MKYKTTFTTVTFILAVITMSFSTFVSYAQSSRYEIANFYAARGDQWFRQKAYDKALADYDVALTIDSKDAATFNKRGLVWLAKEDFGQALADFQRATKLNPKFAAAWHNRGVAWFRKGNLRKALAAYDQAIILNPNFAEALLARGLAKLEMGKDVEAESDFERCVKVDAQMQGELSRRIEGLKTTLVEK